MASDSTTAQLPSFDINAVINVVKERLSVENINKMLIELDTILSTVPLLVELETKTKIPKTHSTIGATILISLLIFFNIGGQLLVNLVGFVYPAYLSFLALETPDFKDDVQWLTYWVVFAFFNVVEFFSDYLLFWIPFYYVIKCVFLLYLYLPQFKGAEVLYRRFIRPFMIEATIRAEKLAKKTK